MRFSRTELIIGSEGVRHLATMTVGVFGLGGVGAATVEALARSGIGQLILVDFDQVSVTDINRQLIALESTLGMYKVDVAKKRIQDINPACNVIGVKKYFQAKDAESFFIYKYDYIVDAIDTLPAKIDLIEKSYRKDIPIIAAMGAGNKLEPAKLTVADISKTCTCPLARKVRLELRKRGINKGIKTVFSKEQPIYERQLIQKQGPANSRLIPGSTAFVPPVTGYIMASEVVRDLLELKR